MSGVDEDKYIRSILFVFAGGALLNLAVVSPFLHGATGVSVSLHAILRPTLNNQGIPMIWESLTSGGSWAALYVWLFNRFLWKASFLQGWMVLFPNLEGTWVGVLTPHTAVMIPSRPLPGDSTISAVPDWAREKHVLPVHVTIKHKLDKLIFTAKHPNSKNETLAYQLVNSEQTEGTTLYVVYRNHPFSLHGEKADPHEGCCKLRLDKAVETKSAKPTWHLRGTYWTDKVRSAHDKEDRGTWGEYHIHYESRSLGEEKTDWDVQKRFDI